MGEINKIFSGKPHVTTAEAYRHADKLKEILKDMSAYDRMVINDQRDLLTFCIRGLGDKGAIELLGKLGIWMVLNNVQNVR